MGAPTNPPTRRRPRLLSRLAVLFLLVVSPASAFLLPSNHPQFARNHGRIGRRDRPVVRRGPPAAGEVSVPLRITNRCDSTIWPAVFTQAGTGPGIGGFELSAGKSRDLRVGPTWQGRIWGRTNCTVSGDSCSCMTGDCVKALDCTFSGAVPATLAEFNLMGGSLNRQAFWDISLVDGYNLPIMVRLMPYPNATYIPPNLVNAACIATPGWLWQPSGSGIIYSNASFPTPWEPTSTNDYARNLCPWDLLKFPPLRPVDGVYAYPDDNVRRPDFSPCLSQCAYSGLDRDCCTGKYHDPKICRPSLYSQHAKKICPDAYSYAYDDQQSTFILPNDAGGYETVFCPKGRSTNILATLEDQLFEIASSGRLSEKSIQDLVHVGFIEAQRSRKGAGTGLEVRAWMVVFATVTAVAAALM